MHASICVLFLQQFLASISTETGFNFPFSGSVCSCVWEHVCVCLNSGQMDNAYFADYRSGTAWQPLLLALISLMIRERKPKGIERTLKSK